MEPTTLREKLEGIKQLKPSYGIGTSDALDYLRTQQELQDLREELLKKLRKEGIKLKPSTRNISNLCTMAKDAVRYAIETLETIARGHPTYPQYEITPAIPTLAKVKKSPHDMIPLNLDYERFITNILKKYEEANDISVALRWATFKFIKDELEQGENYLKDSNRRTIPLKEITNKAESDHVENPDKEAIERSARNVGDFYNWIRTGDCYIHDLEPEALDLEGITEEESTFLYLTDSKEGPDIDHYERALREKTLGWEDVERRISLSYLTRIVDLRDDIQKQIIQTIQDLKRKIRISKEREERLKRLNAPDFIISGEVKLRDRKTYLIRALTENKEWLAAVLSR